MWLYFYQLLSFLIAIIEKLSDSKGDQMPIVEKVIDRLDGARFITMLDLPVLDSLWLSHRKGGGGGGGGDSHCPNFTQNNCSVKGEKKRGRKKETREKKGMGNEKYIFFISLTFKRYEINYF